MNALLLCIDMHNGLHGSFMHTLEYGEYLGQLGYDVHIGSVLIAESNRQLAQQMGFTVHDIVSVPLDIQWDLVYALHGILLPALIGKGIKYAKAIGSTLSKLSRIECLPPSIIWPYFDLFTAVSEEVAYWHVKKFDIKNIFEVIPNHIPLSFMNHSPRKSWTPELERVVVISNHYVPEIVALQAEAPFHVDLIGSLYGNVNLCTPDLLLDYDAVISIGKTVQYCMGLAIPVFEYDRFGGCGYLTPDNVLSEEKTNFSGRGTKNILSTGNLIHRLKDGYKSAVTSSPLLCEISRERYDIGKLLPKQIELVSKKNQARPILRRDAMLYAEQALAAVEYMRGAAIHGA